MSSGRQLRIGVTGGIGSGKSVVCRIFSCLGIPVYNADDRAKWLTDNDIDLKKQIIELLGNEAYLNGKYNRSYVASRVFGNNELLDKLNSLIHPLVKKDAADWNDSVSKLSKVSYTIKEAALMNRAGDSNDFDFVIVVTADENLRMARIRKRDPLRTDDQIRAIINRQISDYDRLAIADFVIENNENSALIDQVLALHHKFVS